MSNAIYDRYNKELLKKSVDCIEYMKYRDPENIISVVENGEETCVRYRGLRDFKIYHDHGYDHSWKDPHPYKDIMGILYVIYRMSFKDACEELTEYLKKKDHGLL